MRAAIRAREIDVAARLLTRAPPAAPPCERSGGKYLRRNHIFSAMKAPRGRLSGVVSAAFLLRELTLMREPEEYLLRYAAARPLIPNLTAPT